MSETAFVARGLIFTGLALVALGLAWPWLVKLGLGSLPGDIHIERKGFSFYFPLTSGLLVSLVVSLVIWFLRR